MFSYKNFIAFALLSLWSILRKIFIWCEVGFQMPLLHVEIQVSQQLLQKNHPFPTEMFQHLLKIKWPLTHGFISGLLILFHWSIHPSVQQHHTVLITFKTWWFCVKFWNKKYESHNFNFFQVCIMYPGSLIFTYEF